MFHFITINIQIVITSKWSFTFCSYKIREGIKNRHFTINDAKIFLNHCHFYHSASIMADVYFTHARAIFSLTHSGSLSGPLWLTLALSDSLWPSLTHSGSLWLTLWFSQALWLTSSFLGSPQRGCIATTIPPCK